MAKLLYLTGGLLAAGAAYALGRSRERRRAEGLTAKLIRGSQQPTEANVDLQSLDGLPPPVARYFRHVLSEGQASIRAARLQQRGVLRTSTTTKNWLSFEARQLIAPPVTGFLWNAKVSLPLATHVRVIDSYDDDSGGGGRVSLLSALPLASDSGAPELDSGALHRYLAEAVWYPTALLPQAGVEWAPISDTSAQATLTDDGVTVSLEFRFNETDEVTGIYTPGRYGRFDNEYRRVPWEGHFADYRGCSGMLVPHYGEVGWYVEDEWRAVWKGDLIEAQYA